MENEVKGKTGEIGRDGLLTPEQSDKLNTLQRGAAEKSFQYLQGMQSEDLFPMIAMATGFGKGNIIHRMIEQQIRTKKDAKVLVIAGTKLALVSQAHDSLSRYQTTLTPENGQDDNISDEYAESENTDALTDDTVSTSDDEFKQKSFLYKTGKYGQSDANVHVTTIQGIQSEAKKDGFNPSEYDLVIVDEVHNVGTRKRLDTIKKFSKVVGFTATPYRSSGEMRDPEQYGFKVIESLPLPEAQEQGFLPPLCGVQIDTTGLVDQVPMTKSGQIDFGQLEKMLKNSPELRPFIADRVAKIISSDERKYKTVIAVNFVWEAEELVKLLTERGISAGIAVNQQAAKRIHSDEVPAMGTIDRYKLPETDEKSLQVLISPYVASEGFDAPATEVLVWASPTDSALRYTQYTGRLARRAEGKAFGVVVDCLFQTSQYNWSYNMGMWMKDKVKQLDNGMLWLGPETDIERLKDLPQVQTLRKQSDNASKQSLEQEGTSDILDTEFPVNKKALLQTFIGESSKLRLVADSIITQLRNEDHTLVVNKRNGVHVIPVIRDRERFINEMKNRGVLEKNLLSIQPTDFSLTGDNLRGHFVGDSQKLKTIAQQVITEMQMDNPLFVANRRNGPNVVECVTDSELFLKKMREKGVEIQDNSLLGVQENDFVISHPSIKSTFVGYSKTVMTVVKDVIEQLAKEDPSILSKRRVGPGVIPVITDKEKFIQAMEKKGIRTQDSTILSVQESDYPITQNNLIATFIGNDRKLRPIAFEIIEQLRGEDPSLVVNRRSGVAIIPAVTDKDRFVEEMLKRGIKLKYSVT